MHIPGGFSYNPLNELLSCTPGVSITPGSCGRKDERESFIFLAEKKVKIKIRQGNTEIKIQHLLVNFM